MKKNNILKENSIYRDFYVLNHLSYKADGKDIHRYYLRHRTTGLELIYFSNPVPQNLFTLSVRTPAFDNSGIFHALEHTVLQGSQNYPFAKMFDFLINRTACFNINARTTPTHTTFHGDSLIESEAFKIMDSIVDAAFFPLLTKEAFWQECWRLELDENDQPKINGIVFNEVKKRFNSPDSITSHLSAKYNRQIPAFNYFHGGDPLEIPSITYEKFVETHQQYYRPDNSLIYYHGSMTVTQLIDHISDNYIPKLQEKFQMFDTVSHWQNPDPKISDDLKHQLQPNIPEAKNYTITLKTETESVTNYKSVEYVWNLYQRGAQNDILCETLSFLQENEIAPKLEKISDTISSYYNTIDDNALFSIIIDGIPKEKYQETIRTFEDILNTIKTKGLPQRVINNVSTLYNICNNFQLDIVPPDGTSELTLRWALGYGLKNNTLIFSQARNLLNRYIKKDRFLNTLFQDGFFNINPIKIEYFNELYPLEKYKSERLEQEHKLTKLLFAKTTPEAIKNQMKLIEKWQNSYDEELVKEKYPYIDLRNTHFDQPSENVSLTYLENGIPLVYSEKKSEIYIPVFTINFPLDYLEPRFFRQYQLISNIFTCLFSRNEHSCEAVSLSYSSYAQKLYNQDALQHTIEKYGNKDIPLRNWISIAFNMMPEEISEAFKVFKADNFPLFHKFTNEEKQRLKTFPPFEETILTQYAEFFYKMRLISTIDNQSTIQELLNGYTACNYYYDFSQTQSEEFYKDAEDFWEQLSKGGCFINFSCVPRYKKAVLKEIKQLVQEFNLEALQPKIEHDYKELQSHILNAETPMNKLIPSTEAVGSCYSLIPLEVPYSSKEAQAQIILCNWLSNNLLKTKLRHEHGCYGASIVYLADIGYVRFETTQDPAPEETENILKQIIKEIEDKEWTEEDYREIQLSNFTADAMYRTPDELLTASFDNLMNGQTKEDLDKDNEVFYSITPEDLHQAAIRLNKNMDKIRTSIISVNK